MYRVFVVFLLFGAYAHSYVVKTEDILRWFPKYNDIIYRYAKLQDIPIDRVISTIQVESSGNPTAVSSEKCMGLMQIMPSTAIWLKCIGKDQEFMLFHPATNVNCGVKYLKYLWNIYKDWDMVHFAYNWGPGNVAKLRKRGVKPSSIKYVRKIKSALIIVKQLH